MPNLRFPEFTGEWRKERLKNKCSFFSGGTPSSTNKEYYDGNIPFIRSGEISKSSTELYLSESGLNNSSAKIIEEGDLLLALYGATSGQIAISKINGAINQAILCIRTPYDKKFLKSLWEKNVNKILQAYLQGGQGNLSAEIVKNLYFSFPSINEQKKIGKLIELLDNQITTQSKIIEKLQSLIGGLNDYLQEKLETILSISFSEMGEDYSGLSGKSANDFGAGKSFVPYTNVYANTFIDERKLGLVTIHDGESQSRVLKGDVLFTLSSETPEEVCYGSVYWGEAKELYLNSFCFGIHITNDKVFSPYLAYFINSKGFRKKVFPLAQGSTRFNLQKSDFMRKLFHLPSKSNQKKIFYTLNALDKKLNVEKSTLEYFQQQKIFLINQMFI